MRIEVHKKQLEKMFDERRFEELYKLLKMSFDSSTSNSIITFLEKSMSKNTYSMKTLKDYLIDAVLKSVRSHNQKEDMNNFIPYVQKKKFYKRRLNDVLTPDEAKFLKHFRKSVLISIKRYNGKLTEETYNTLKRVYDYDKDMFYTGIHRTGANIDNIFENGICFGSVADFNNHVQIEHNFDQMLCNISSCEGYKYSKGCFIIKVPKKAIDEKTEPVFYNDGESIFLDPKYVVMYAPVYRQRILTPELNSEMKIVTPTMCEGDSMYKLKKM